MWVFARDQANVDSAVAALKAKVFVGDGGLVDVSDGAALKGWVNRALAVVDVGLILDPLDGNGCRPGSRPGRAAAPRPPRRRAPAEIIVELELEEAADLVLAVEVPHHHQRRILGERLAEHRPALHVGADHLVRPILVGELVRGDIGRHSRSGPGHPCRRGSRSIPNRAWCWRRPGRSCRSRETR